MVFSQKNNFPPRGHPSLWKARTPRVLRTSAKLHLFLVLFGSKTRYFSFSTLFSKPNSTKLMLIKFLHTAGSERATAYFTVVVRLRAHVQLVGAGIANSWFSQFGICVSPNKVVQFWKKKALTSPVAGEIIPHIVSFTVAMSILDRKRVVCIQPINEKLPRPTTTT